MQRFSLQAHAESRVMPWDPILDKPRDEDDDGGVTKNGLHRYTLETSDLSVTFLRDMEAIATGRWNEETGEVEVEGDFLTIYDPEA